MAVTIGAILLIVTLTGIILLANQIDNWTKRERGIPKSERRKLPWRRNGRH